MRHQYAGPTLRLTIASDPNRDSTTGVPVHLRIACRPRCSLTAPLCELLLLLQELVRSSVRAEVTDSYALFHVLRRPVTRHLFAHKHRSRPPFSHTVTNAARRIGRDVCSPFTRSAPRGALLYPRCSRDGLGGRFLGPMAHLDPKGEGNNSLPGKQRSCSGVWNEVLRGPCDMANSWIA